MAIPSRSTLWYLEGGGEGLEHGLDGLQDHGAEDHIDSLLELDNDGSLGGVVVEQTR